MPRATLAAAAGVVGVGAVAPDGWKDDLPLGQRIVNDVSADLNLVAYAGTAVQPDPCLTSLPAYIYARDFTTGESLIFTGGVVQPYYFSNGRRGRPRAGRIGQPDLLVPDTRPSCSPGKRTRRSNRSK